MARRRRGWIVGIAVLVAAWIVYLAVANLLLRLWVPDLLARRPEKLVVEWDDAWTLLPGLFHVRGLEIREQNRHVQWHGTLDRGWGIVSLFGLTHEELHLRYLSGRGMEVRLRRRIDTHGDPGPGAPPIPGFANPPDPPPEELYPPKPPEGRWTHRYDRFRVEGCREIWIDRYRFRGEATVRGGFSVRPRSWIEMERVELEGISGRVTIAEDPVATELEGRIGWTVPRFETRDRPNPEMLDLLDGRVELETHIEDLGFLDAYLDALPRIAVTGGRGRIRAEARAREGAFEPDSRIEADVDDLELYYFGWRAQGRAVVDWRVQPGPRARLEVRFPEFGVLGPGAASAHIEGEGLEVVAATTDVRLRGEREDLSLEMQMPQARIRDFTYYDRYVPRATALRFVGGDGSMQGRFEATRRSGRGRISIDGKGARALYQDLELTGDFHLSTEIAEVNLEEGRFLLDGSRLDIEEAGVVGEEEGLRDWSASLLAQRAELRLGDTTSFDGRFRTWMRDTGPLIAVFVERKPLVGLVRERLVVPDAEGEATVEAGPSSLEIRELAFGGEGLEVRGCLSARPDWREGALYFRSKRLDVGVALLPPDRRDLHLFGSRRWFFERQEICRPEPAGGGG